jgi:glutathione S-transferase
MAAQAPEKPLLPESGMGRWRALEMLNFIATELHKGFSPLFRKDLTPEWRAGVVANLQKKFDVVEAVLARQPFLTGETFALPDIYAFTVLRWSKQHNLDLAPWPNITAYLARIAARPAVKEALSEEGLLQPA